MVKKLTIFSIVLLLFFAVPPLIILFNHKDTLYFVPQLFINEWFSFILRTMGSIFSFYLIYVIWRQEKDKEIASVDKRILIYHLNSSIRLVDKCIEMIKEFPSNGQKSSIVNKNIQGKIKGLNALTTILSILKNSSLKNVNHEFAILLEELETNSEEPLGRIREITEFTSNSSNGLEELMNFREILFTSLQELEERND